MNVWSSDGEKLGKVVQCGSDGFLIEKGLFFRKEYSVAYSDVADVRGDDVILRIGSGALREEPAEGAGYKEEAAPISRGSR